MNYYLTPRHIAESLHLAALRKSTPDGLFLLSESDLVAYGIERAKSEGAVELSNQPRQAEAAGENPSGASTPAPAGLPTDDPADGTPQDGGGDESVPDDAGPASEEEQNENDNQTKEEE